MPGFLTRCQESAAPPRWARPAELDERRGQMTTEIVRRGPGGMAEQPTTGGDGGSPSQTLEQFIERGHILADVPIQAAQVQPASLDLRLGAVAYRIRASFFPGLSAPVMAKVAGLQIHEIDLERSAVLEPGCIYLVPLLEA